MQLRRIGAGAMLAAVTLIGMPFAAEAREVQVPNEQIPAVATDEAADDNAIHDAVEVLPEYPGGISNLMRWLGENIRYPESAQMRNVAGKVVVRFVVEKDGSITNGEIIKSVDPSLDEEALRLVRNMQPWTAGRNDANTVRCHMILPITFRLQVDAGEETKEK